MENKKTNSGTKVKKEVNKIENVTKENVRYNKEKIQSVVIIILSLIIVFGLAFVVPELKNCGSCKEEEVELTNITMDDYRTLLNSDEVSLIYIANPGCGYCQQQEPVMEELIREYNVTVNYLNTSTITNDEADEVYALYGPMQEERYQTDGVRTPTIIVVQNGSVLDMNLGNMELDGLVEMLQKYTEIGE